jgi:virginiamycin B lyase
VAAVAVPTLNGGSGTTTVANPSRSQPRLADDQSTSELTLGDEGEFSDVTSTTTWLPRTTTTVTPTTSHVDMTPVGDTENPAFPESPPVEPDKLITEFKLPTKGAWPYGITAGSDGALWFAENGSAAGYSKVSGIGRITTSGEITEYPIGEPVGPVWITSGSDGALWFTEAGGSSIGRITTDGTITQYAVGSYHVWSITAGPDGALWFTQRATQEGGFVVRMTTSGQVTKFKTPHDFAVAMAFGPDGNIWVADQGGFVSRMTPQGEFTEFAVNFEQGGYGGYVGDIVAGPDGAMWFSWSGMTQPYGWLGRITMDGELSRVKLPTDGAPAQLVSADGYLWTTMNNSNVIVRVAPDGGTTAYAAKRPMGITVGPDDNIWFTETEGNAIGRLDTGLANLFP